MMLDKLDLHRAFKSRLLTGIIPHGGVGIQTIRLNSSFDQLKNASASTNPNKGSTKDNKVHKFTAIETIDSLLKDSPPPESKPGGSGVRNLFENSVPHPRDVAKNIRLQKPIAGRTVDVHYGNISWALNNLNSLIRNNKIRYLKKVQSRYIPPAKYAKQRKREWWRKQFSRGFKDLMGQVRDAKRRGY